MDKSEFISIRKRLAKTQKELAALLGVSLKAISSYEQGWRNIPGHVERQLLFLLAKRDGGALGNCWDIRKCADELKHSCPAWEFNAGDMCWFINGTNCDKGIKKTWHEKIEVCRACEVFKTQLDL